MGSTICRTAEGCRVFLVRPHLHLSPKPLAFFFQNTRIPSLTLRLVQFFKSLNTLYKCNSATFDLTLYFSLSSENRRETLAKSSEWDRRTQTDTLSQPTKHYQLSFTLWQPVPHNVTTTQRDFARSLYLWNYYIQAFSITFQKKNHFPCWFSKLHYYRSHQIHTPMKILLRFPQISVGQTLPKFFKKKIGAWSCNCESVIVNLQLFSFFFFFFKFRNLPAFPQPIPCVLPPKNRPQKEMQISHVNTNTLSRNFAKYKSCRFPT
jgi:hypothetical protein